MKKIIVFNGYYLPSECCGGPVTSIRNTVNSCCDEFEFYIVALNHDFGSKIPFENVSEGWNQIENAKVLYVEDGYFDFNTKHLKKLFDDVNPDLIWFSGILHPEIKFCTMKIANRREIPVLFSPRGEVSKERVAIKGYKKKPFLFLVSKLGVYKNAWFHATSDDEYAGLKHYIGATEDRITKVRNISVSAQSERSDYKKQKGKLRIAFISRIHKVKNLDYAIRVVAPLKFDVVFDIYGPQEVPEYWNKCLQLANGLAKNIQINYCGVLSPDKVGETFRKYDSFLFPTINENYGHVIAEALASGCPAILSRGTTPWDDLDGTAGYVCKLENPIEFTEALIKIANMDCDTFNQMSKNTIKYYKAKLKFDAAVQGHKKMFDNIIQKAMNISIK